MCRLTLQQLDYQDRADALGAIRLGRFYEREQRKKRKKERMTVFIDEYARARGGSADSSSEWLSCRSLTEAQDLIHLNKAFKQIVAEYCRSVASGMHQTQQSLNSAIVELRLE